MDVAFTRNRMKIVAELHQTASKPHCSHFISHSCVFCPAHSHYRHLDTQQGEQDREIDMGLMWCACQKGNLTFHVLTTLHAPPSCVHASFGLSTTPRVCVYSCISKVLCNSLENGFVGEGLVRWRERFSSAAH